MKQPIRFAKVTGMGAYVRIAEMREVPPGNGLAVEINGRPIAVVNADGAFFVLNNFGSVESNLGRT